MTTAIAVLALATAGYALWRLDSTRDRLDQVNDAMRAQERDRQTLQGEVRMLAERERASARELIARLEALDPLPRQVQDLTASVDDLHARTQGPQRAWSRAEALFLVEIAQRSVVLDRDATTAIAALEAADSRLASVRDPTLTSVRQQIASDLQKLRAVRLPDRTGLMVRLSTAEELAAQLPVRGLVASASDARNRTELPDGFFARASALVQQSLASLVRVRPIDAQLSVVTQDEQLVRRQHLQLLLLSARTAVARHDQAAYRSALAAARRWIGEFFDASEPRAVKLLGEVQLLEGTEIDPVLPDISKSAQALQQLAPASEAVEK